MQDILEVYVHAEGTAISATQSIFLESSFPLILLRISFLRKSKTCVRSAGRTKKDPFSVAQCREVSDRLHLDRLRVRQTWHAVIPAQMSGKLDHSGVPQKWTMKCSPLQKKNVLLTLYTLWICT